MKGKSNMDDLTVLHKNIKKVIQIANTAVIKSTEERIESTEGLIKQLETISFDKKVIDAFKEELSLLKKQLNLNNTIKSLVDKESIRELS